jgi:hypothetical protein
MFWMMSPAMAKAIAREQTVDAVRESRRRGRVARFTPEPDTDAKSRHKARRTSRALRSADLRKRVPSHARGAGSAAH